MPRSEGERKSSVFSNLSRTARESQKTARRRTTDPKDLADGGDGRPKRQNEERNRTAGKWRKSRNKVRGQQSSKEKEKKLKDEKRKAERRLQREKTRHKTACEDSGGSGTDRKCFSGDEAPMFFA
ncbi:UNVERIFIED_CONTAM: hypothetical protein HHA_306990 [Hammondia hammondi]|eukprot:XP_008888081.1 hypothetical protein HHA_306990 [Hammondia hammondi]